MGDGKKEMNKGPWTREEDQKLLAYIEEHGHGSWRTLPAKAGLERCGKSCRLRWTNYLRPDIKRGKFSTHEEKTIVRLHALLGNRWSAIAAHLPQRTDNEIKNYWNTRLKKRLTRMGIDPVTHKPKNNRAGSAALSHMAQWETARLEAEARLARDSKLAASLRHLHREIAPPPPPPPPCLDVLKVWQATAIPNCFLTSPAGTLDSPTSTLNFSSSSLAVPTVGANDIVFDHGPTCKLQAMAPPMVVYTDNYTKMEGKMENSQQDDNIVCPMSYDLDVMGAMDHSSLFDHDSDAYKIGGLDVGEYECSHNYWNELLDLVSTTMGSPT